MEHGTQLAITLINTLLDTKDMPKDMRILLRDMTGPALEYIGNGSSPKDVMTRVTNLKLVMQIPIALGIHMSIHPDSYDEVALNFGERDYNELKELLAILTKIVDTSKDAKVNQSNIDLKANIE